MRKIGFLAAIGAVFLWVSPASAANTCNVKEYAAMGSALNGAPQVAQEPALVDQTPVDASSVHSSAAFNAQTRYIYMYCDSQTSYVVGPSPQTATTNNSRMINGLYVGVTPGHVVSFIANP